MFTAGGLITERLFPPLPINSIWYPLSYRTGYRGGMKTMLRRGGSFAVKTFVISRPRPLLSVSKRTHRQTRALKPQVKYWNLFFFQFLVCCDRSVRILLLSSVLCCFRYSIRSACFSTTSSRLEPSLFYRTHSL